MKIETRRQRTPLRMRAAVDTNGAKYELQEWSELVSVNANGIWSPWEPFNSHGQAMTCKGVDLERISPTQWTLGYPPVDLTILE